MFSIRAPISVCAGAVLSVALFLGLWQLVSAPFAVEQMAQARRIEFTPQIRDTPADNKRDPQVTREARVLEPSPTKLSAGGSGIDVIADYPRPPLDPVVERGGSFARGMDGDAIPMVRVQPDYPPRATASNTEGWAQVRFSVTTAGTVRDSVVVASEPGTIFDDAALKAVARWRYNPRVVDGVAVERVGLETVFRFELE